LRPARALSSERYYGVDVAEDGALIVAERHDGNRCNFGRFPAGAAGVQALREHIAQQPSRTHICIRACGGAALAVAVALMSLPVAEVTLVAPRSLEARRPGAATAPLNAEARAERLARRAEHFF